MRRSCRGFTLGEIAIAPALLAIVVLGPGNCAIVQSGIFAGRMDVRVVRGDQP